MTNIPDSVGEVGRAFVDFREEVRGWFTRLEQKLEDTVPRREFEELKKEFRDAQHRSSTHSKYLITTGIAMLGVVVTLVSLFFIKG